MASTDITNDSAQIRLLRNSLRRLNAGFSLIELLIAIAVIGIIAAVGLPNYLDYVTKTRRTDAHFALLNVYQEMERCKAVRFSYASCELPEFLEESNDGNYAISLETTASSFTATATAQEKQENDSKCPTLTLNDKNLQGHTGDGPCW